MNGLSRLPRLYVDPALVPVPNAGATCPIPPEQARYLGTVLRRKAGDQVRVFHAGMGEWLASIADIRKDRGSLALVRQIRPPQPCPPLQLAFALLKRDATDLVIRMGTELGVSTFLPLVSERTNTHRVNPERLHAIAVEAAEQCERLDIPTIAPVQTLPTLLGQWPQTSTLFAAIERLGERTAEPNHTPPQVRAGDGLLIGPEGGLSDAECQTLLQRPFVTPFSLGSLVLRADTAVVAGLALLGNGLRSAPVSSQ
ncbi:16S rRNA (uracil(1498)-N(3))-methyltransferase [Acetobacter okinawensis]|uniref:16S rRNA (uracil(1498)-N(3))-methyltransferase n=1 Tax=Acetobacter okinawensis TaxID=1076594 RepID=UPI00209D9201|nr:16S rRNA (uracil(1498)-N(3))-methyltransferase [Acetobacter okinawensis]MCP1213100.1 16S rRNA (uracil(1498)-N(3))-methyltransferase [Acetobacter okinawensis]